MILINNRQRKIVLDIEKLRKVAQSMLECLRYQDADLGILLTTNATIRKYNKQYRGKDKATDILSFSYHPHLKAGKRIRIRSEDDNNLGDLIISLEYANRDAPKRWNRSFEQHLYCLIAHGIAHLLGHDHQEDDEYKIMYALEKKLLRYAKKQHPFIP